MRRPASERARAMADPDRRQWVKALDFADEIDEAAQYGATLTEAFDRLRTALDDKAGAQESETGEDLRDSLANAWEEVSGALEEIADALDALSELTP